MASVDTTITSTTALKRTKIYQSGNIVILEYISPMSGDACKREFYARGQYVYDADTDNQVCYGLASRGDTLMISRSLLSTIRAEWPQYRRSMVW